MPNSVDNQYYQNSDLLYTFTLIKSYTYLLNVEPRNLAFLKTYNAELDEIIITFTDRNVIPLQIGDKVNVVLLINK